MWLLTHHQVDKIVLGATGGLSTVFALLPVCFFFSARANAIYFAYLKTSWEDAQVKNDKRTLRKLDDQLSEFIKNMMSKPFWATKWL